MSSYNIPILLQCPHCQDYFEVLIQEINCSIFRHARFKNGNEVNPHSKKEKLDEWIKRDLIYGCGKPFRIVFLDNQFGTEVCEYL
jgi:hypothetical protein